jgi:hypothetical protein
MMDMAAQELGVCLRQATRSLFRLEMEPVYDVPTDGSDFQRYLAGEPWPDLERKERWLLCLREQRDKGIYRSRVRVVNTPLSDYDRYAFEWGYAYNVPAGDDTRILNLAEQLSLPIGLGLWHDFWLIDDERAVRMRYNRKGEFLGADLIDPDQVGTYRQFRAAAWEVAEPFDRWWQAHPEYHRSARKAS